MASVVECKIEMKSPPWKEMADKLKAALPGVLAANLQTQRAMVFDTEGRYNGRPGWAPLKHRKGQILKDTGTLSKSMGPKPSGNKPGHAVGSILRMSDNVVTIGTDIAYAAIHNNGALIAPHEVMTWRSKKTGKFQKFSKKRGKLEIHNVRGYWIPARTFNDFTPQDAHEITTALEGYITSVLGGAS